MRKPLEPSSRLVPCLLLALGALFQLPALAVMAGWRGGTAPAWLMALLNTAGAALVFLAPPRERGWFSRSRHWAHGMGLIALCLPGIGWLIGAWVYLRNPRAHLAKEAYVFEEDDSDRNPLATMGTPAEIRKQFLDAANIVPAADALLRGDRAVKRGALEMLAKIRTPQAIAWILKSRLDPDPETRFYATSSLTRIKTEFENSIHAAEDAAARNPTDTAARFGLQRILYEYATSGILDARMRASMLGQCRERLSAERDLHSARLGFLVEKELDPARALGRLDELQRRDLGMERRWLRERASLLFALGRFAEVRDLFKARPDALAGGDAAADRDWRTAYLWWSDA